MGVVLPIQGLRRESPERIEAMERQQSALKDTEPSCETQVGTNT